MADDVQETAPGATNGEPPSPPPGEGTPEGARLVEAQRAFEEGDYRRLRQICEGLLEAPDADVARAARALRRRTEVDPVQVGVILACLVLFIYLTYTFVFR